MASVDVPNRRTDLKVVLQGHGALPRRDWCGLDSSDALSFRLSDRRGVALLDREAFSRDHVLRFASGVGIRGTAETRNLPALAAPGGFSFLRTTRPKLVRGSAGVGCALRVVPI